VEQVFADLADGAPGPPALSGSFPANAAWLACAAIAHNLLRAAGSLASLAWAKARGATLRRDLISVAARIACHGRGQIILHLPQDWHRETEWMSWSRMRLTLRRSMLNSRAMARWLWRAGSGPPRAARGLSAPGSAQR
jgi:hypothetical protein